MLVLSHLCTFHSLPNTCRIPPPPTESSLKGHEWHLTQMPCHSPTSSLCGNVCILLLETASSRTFMTYFPDFQLFWLLLLHLLLWLLFIFPLSKIMVSPRASSYPSLSFLSSSPSTASHILQLQPSPLYKSLPISTPSLFLTPHFKDSVRYFLLDNLQHLKFNTFQIHFPSKSSMVLMTPSSVKGLRTPTKLPHPQPVVKPDPLCILPALCNPT